jgi:coenzyme PQQ biosynthesis protein PqqD
MRAEMMDGELLLYDPSGSRIIQLNGTAALIWQMCDGKRKVEEIIALLQAAYPDTAESIALDVPEMLSRWAETGCLELL